MSGCSMVRVLATTRGQSSSQPLLAPCLAKEDVDGVAYAVRDMPILTVLHFPQGETKSARNRPVRHGSEWSRVRKLIK